MQFLIFHMLFVFCLPLFLILFDLLRPRVCFCEESQESFLLYYMLEAWFCPLLPPSLSPFHTLLLKMCLWWYCYWWCVILTLAKPMVTSVVCQGGQDLPLCALTPAPTAKGDLAVSSPCERSVAPLVLGCVVFSWVTDTQKQ